MPHEHDPFAGVLEELQAERARSLGLVAERMVAAIALRTHDERGGASDGDERGELLAHARERVWYFVVQRESMGLTDLEVALGLYQVPAEVRAQLGPRRR